MLAVAITVGFILVIVGLLFGRRMWAVRSWQTVARETGLRFRGSFGEPLDMAGEYRGVSIHFHTQKQGVDQSTGQHTTYEVELPDSVPPRLEVQTKSLFGGEVRDEPIELHDPEWDRHFTITGDDPDEIRDWLESGVGDALLDLYDVRSDFEIDMIGEGKLTFRDSGLELSGSDLMAYLDAAADCVQAMRRAESKEEERTARGE